MKGSSLNGPIKATFLTKGANRLVPLFNNIDGHIYDFGGQSICEITENSDLVVEISALESAAEAINNDPDNFNFVLLELLQNGIISYTQYANYMNNSSSIGQSMDTQIDGLNDQLAAISCKVLLKWRFKSNYDVRKVELFRGRNGNPIEHYKDYQLSDITTEQGTENMAIFDNNVDIGERYTYKILIHLKNQMMSPLSQEFTILIEE